jgi:dolichyl-phosphate beta-glucosyltransferase
MLAATGEVRLMTDADLSTPIEEFPRLLSRLDDGHEIAIGSRALPESRVEVRQPWYRESLGRFFNLLVRLVALPGLHDTQCGFKLFTAAAARQAFEPARLDGFSFDVETLLIARRRGLKIAEVPVTWRNDAATRVGLARGGQAFLDLLRIRANDLAGRYDVRRPYDGL